MSLRSFFKSILGMDREQIKKVEQPQIIKPKKIKSILFPHQIKARRLRDIAYESRRKNWRMA